MTTRMPHDKTRFTHIQTLQFAAEEDAGGRDKLPYAKLMMQGRVVPAPIYRFPLSDLHFNKGNGRIRSEVLAYESQQGRRLDPSIRDDQTILKKLLLAIRTDENEKIKSDLSKNGQLQPGIITCDGIVINGNRRKALLEELHDDTHADRFSYLEVHVLPSNITKAEVWLIEAGIQLSAPQQLDYSPINNLLQLREGKRSGIGVDDMAARIYGASAERLREDLARLDLIDEYLNDYLDKDGSYFLLREKHEHFIDLQNILSWLARPRGNVQKDWDPTKSDIAELKIVAFHLIRAQFPHMRIRDLRDLFCIKASWDELRRSVFDVPVELADDEQDETDVLDDTEDAYDFENELLDDDLQSTAIEELSLVEEASWRKQNRETLKTFFESAKEERQIHSEAKRPLLLAKRAIRNIGGIRKDSDGFDDPELDEALGKIIRMSNELRKDHQKSRRTKTPQKKKRKKKKTGKTDTAAKKGRHK